MRTFLLRGLVFDYVIHFAKLGDLRGESNAWTDGKSACFGVFPVEVGAPSQSLLSIAASIRQPSAVGPDPLGWVPRSRVR
jgi:hypothetical protein